MAVEFHECCNFFADMKKKIYRVLPANFKSRIAEGYMRVDLLEICPEAGFDNKKNLQGLKNLERLECRAWEA